MNRHRVLLPMVAVALLLVAAACGGGGGERVTADGSTDRSPATGAVAAAATETRSVDSMRFEMAMTIALGSSPPTDTGVFASGEIDGSTVAVRTDVGAFVEAVAGLDTGGTGDLDLAGLDALAGGDLDLEVVTDGTVQFFRGGLLGALARLDPDAAAVSGELAAIGDGWGYVELAELAGLTPADLTSMAGATSIVAPDDLLSMLEAAGTEVNDLGVEEVRGVPTTRYGASVSLMSLGVLTGQDPDAIADSFDGAGVPDGALDDLVEEMFAVFEGWTIPVHVWVDGDGRTRRVEITISTAEITAAIQAAFGATDVPADEPALTVTVRMDTWDFDDPAIDVTLPDREAAVDLTDAFARLAPG